jgi:Pyridoxamine 5'-phosphate oxidase
MNRQKNAVSLLNTDPLAKELLQSSTLVRMAYTGTDGFPRVVPLGFYWDGAQFFVCTAPNAPKVHALENNPKVAMTIDTNTLPPHVLLVRGTARLEIVDGVPLEFLEASHKYIEPQQWPEFDTQTRILYKQMARIAIIPEWAKLLDFETRLPSAIEALAG